MKLQSGTLSILLSLVELFFKSISSAENENNSVKSRFPSDAKPRSVAKSAWNCGRPKFAPAFTHDVPIENALPHSWPWAVPICQQEGSKTNCVIFVFHGTIVAPRWVLGLSAGSTYPGTTFIRAGVNNITDKHESGIRDYKIDSVYKCPHCAMTGHSSVNCPALFKLREEIEFNDHVSPVCLAGSDDAFVGQSDAILHNWPIFWPPDLPSTYRYNEYMGIDVMKQWNLTIENTPTTNLFKAKNSAGDFFNFAGDGVVKWRTDRWLQHAIFVKYVPTGDYAPLLQISQCCEWFEETTSGEVKCSD